MKNFSKLIAAAALATVWLPAPAQPASAKRKVTVKERATLEQSRPKHDRHTSK